MIANIRAEFKIMLKANTWMDNESKKPADEKVSNFQYFDV
jgi:predicted metalloendopeptidase